MQVIQSGTFRAHLAAERAGAAIAPVVILLPLAILILWGVSGAMSRAVQDIGRQAAQQDEHTIAELPLERVPQELKPLVASFNSLLTRLRDAFATQRRFVQDAAHELRTPITAVALQLENVRGDMPAGACQQSLGQLEAGVSRAQRLVDQLLKLSRQEAPVMRGRRSGGPARAVAREHERADRAGRPAQHRPGPGGRNRRRPPAPSCAARPATCAACWTT